MFGQSSSKARKQAKAKAETLHHQLSDFKDNAGERFSEHSQRAQQLTRDGARQVDQHARDYPWVYVAGGTVLGLAMGYLLGRRR